MILSFKDKETEKIFNEEFSKKLPQDIQNRAKKKLIILSLANSLSDLTKPPSNKLEPLLGKRTGEWSIRINNQWRITFTPVNNGADYVDVSIEDYH